MDDNVGEDKKLGRCGAHTRHAAAVRPCADADVEGFKTFAEGLVPAIDILVNNAGIAGVSKPLWECSCDEWREVIELDLIAVFHVCKSVIPSMMAKKSGQIINIASIAGKEGNPNASHYSAAKAGVIGLTKSLGKELATSGVRVHCVAPAAVSYTHLTLPTKRIE